MRKSTIEERDAVELAAKLISRQLKKELSDLTDYNAAPNKSWCEKFLWNFNIMYNLCTLSEKLEEWKENI